MSDWSQDSSRQQDRHVWSERYAGPADDVRNHPHAEGAESAHPVHDVAHEQHSEHWCQSVYADCNIVGYIFCMRSAKLHNTRKLRRCLPQPT